LLIRHNTCDSIGVSFNTCLWNYLILKILCHEILNIHKYTEIFFTFLFQCFFNFENFENFNISTNEIISVEGWSSQGYYDIFIIQNDSKPFLKGWHGTFWIWEGAPYFGHFFFFFFSFFCFSFLFVRIMSFFLFKPGLLQMQKTKSWWQTQGKFQGKNISFSFMHEKAPII
jgi:hypothetical protein